MCGIVGMRYADGERAPEGVFDAMLGALAHRGPDDHGVHADPKAGVWLGHARLSILDLSARGHQPMGNEAGTCQITYNGEVYNFGEIRDELEARGHAFRSGTDTEVVLKAFETWGPEALDRFRGMFAFAVWDAGSGRLTLVRDRAGVKPLYYFRDERVFLFASEIRALLQHPRVARRLDTRAVSHYLQFGYLSAPDSVFEGIRTVRPGHYLVVDAEHRVREEKYWDILDHYRAGIEQERSGYWDKRPEDDVAEELEELMARGFRYRMVADVPVGLFLSGGIDSSLVAAILVKKLGIPIKSFTIGYADSPFDEAVHARRVADLLGTEHRELMVAPRTLLDAVAEMPRIYDEPFGDNSGIPTYLVSRMAREHVKVALSADGADELFAGYARYPFLHRFQGLFAAAPGPVHGLARAVLAAVPPPAVVGAHRLLTAGRGPRAAVYDKVLKVRNMLGARDPAGQYEAATSYWHGRRLAELLPGGRAGGDPILREAFAALADAPLMTRMMCADFKKYMVDDILTKVDRASMSVGLEVREPFLDHDLLAFAARLPLRYKYRDGEKKYLLKKILARYLPREVFERPKQGFAAPIGAWLKGPLKPLVETHLAPGRVAGVFDGPAVARAVDGFYRGGRVSGIDIWYLLEFQLWRERWLDGPEAGAGLAGAGSARGAGVS